MALPAAGWTIADQETIDPTGTPPNPAGHRLHLQGYDTWQAEVRLDTDQDATTALVSVSEIDQDRAPYSQFPPAVPMPTWYPQLPSPPQRVRRYQIRITHSITDASSYLIEYHDSQPEDQLEGRADTLADHYRTTLPEHGWTILDQQNRPEQQDVEDGTIQRRQHAIQFDGHGVTGTLAITQETAFNGQWLPARLSITISPVQEPG